jgi:hypothetical protein
MLAKCFYTNKRSEGSTMQIGILGLRSSNEPHRGHRRLLTGDVDAVFVAVIPIGTAACRLPLSRAVLSAAALDRNVSDSMPPVGGASSCIHRPPSISH